MTIITRLLVAIFLPIAVMASPGAAQTDTTFSYQGSLEENGVAVNGAFNFEFSLWDAMSGGNQIGSTIVMNGVPVTDGLFTVALDFGGAAFDNSNRWLEIDVNTTTLSPRQLITRAPYSIQTRGIFVDDAGKVGIGTTQPVGPLDVADTQPWFTLHDTDSTGDEQVGWVSFLDADDVETAWIGFVEDSNLYVRNNIGNIVLRPGGNPINFTTAGTIGIGTTSPLAPITIDTDWLTGMYVKTSGGDAIVGLASSLGGNRAGVLGQSNSETGRGVSGVATTTTGVAMAVRGRCDSASGYDFYADGAGTDYGSSSSRRWKHNIENIDNSLYKLSKLRGVYYDWDEEHGGHHDVGMIAEEVGAILPEIVNYEENGIDAIGMDYSKMTPLLVEAVNALRAENASLHAAKNAEIERLDSANEALNERIATLELMVSQLASPEQEIAQ